MNYRAFQYLVMSPEQGQIRDHIPAEYPGTPLVQVEFRDFDIVMGALRAVVPKDRIEIVDPTRRGQQGAGLALVGVGGVNSGEINQMLAALKVRLVKAGFDPTNNLDQQIISLMIGTIWDLRRSLCRGAPPSWGEIGLI